MMYDKVLNHAVVAKEKTSRGHVAYMRQNVGLGPNIQTLLASCDS